MATKAGLLRSGSLFGAGLAVLFALFAQGSAWAWHWNKSHYVRAMSACLPGQANTATSEGIPACSPPSPVSDCATDPEGARRLAVGSRGDFVLRPTGRRLTRGNRSVVDIDTRLRFKGVERCDGGGLGQDLNVTLAFRMTLQDPACRGGLCTVPDMAVPHPVRCGGRRCRANLRTNEHLEAAGLPDVPSGFPWIGEVLEISLVDPAGRPVLSPGIRLGNGSPQHGAEFPFKANRWEARMVRAYRACKRSLADTVTSGGLLACSNPPPLSDCSQDPSHALSVTPEGKGKLRILGKRGIAVLKGRIFGIMGCSGEPYTGPLRAVAMVRVTLEDSACAGGFCTAIDTPVEAQLNVFKGKVVVSSIPLSGLPVGDSTVVNVEILRLEILDLSGSPVFTGNGMFIRCNPARPGKQPFCFGN